MVIISGVPIFRIFTVSLLVTETQPKCSSLTLLTVMLKSAPYVAPATNNKTTNYICNRFTELHIRGSI